MAIVPQIEQYHSSPEPSRITKQTDHRIEMKVFALTLLSLLALSQARMDYTLQCARNEIGIRWPSYHSNSEYYVCQGVYGSQLTVHCPPGEVFTFVLQQCASPAHYIPAPPMDVLPTAAPITMHLIEDSPPVISALSELEHESAEHHHEHSEHYHEHHHEEEEAHPIPPTPAPEPPTPPTVEISKPAVPMPNKVKKPTLPVPIKKPAVPVPNKLAKKPTASSTSAAAKKTPPTPSKAAKKPSPPKPMAKKPASA